MLISSFFFFFFCSFVICWVFFFVIAVVSFQVELRHPHMADRTDVARGCIASVVSAALTTWINSLLFTWVHAVVVDGSENFRNELRSHNSCLSYCCFWQRAIENIKALAGNQINKLLIWSVEIQLQNLSGASQQLRFACIHLLLLLSAPADCVHLQVMMLKEEALTEREG